ncbi:MAG: hypothetical protein IKD06_01140 [Clostridia bacterium]|nr:hypothetical protein [Clostridia bacterium]
MITQNIRFGTGKTQVVFDARQGCLQKLCYGDLELALAGGLWRLQTREGMLLPEDMEKFSYALTSDCLQLCWTDSRATVTVTVCDGKDSKLRWRIKAETGESDSLSRVCFPVLTGLSFEEDNYLLIPWQNGHLIKNPVENFLRKKLSLPFWLGRGKHSGENDYEYPASLSFQYCAFYSPASVGCYLATEDGEAYIKTYTFAYNEPLQAMDFVLTHYPENMGKVQSYEQPYDFVLQLFEGEWQEATCIYRRWATRQKWCKTKLVERSLPEKLVRTDLWRINHNHYDHGAKTEEYFETSLRLRDALQCNLALHWYGWNKSKHDLDYPEYIRDDRRAEGWPKELKEWNRRFDEEGIVKIPYTNARLWEEKTRSWKEENAKAFAIKNEKGELPLEPWMGDGLRPMCPATPMWQEKVRDLCREYSLEAGFDGIYLDQVGSFNATLCFDEAHPHPVGGGSWWNDGYHDMLRQAREVLGEEAIITTESNCETYIDAFDLFLILDTCFQTFGFNDYSGGNAVPLPLFSMIYGDYALGYGSVCKFENSTETFEYNFMRNLLWGILPCVEGPDAPGLQGASAEEKLRILKNGVDFYKANKELFLYGRLCRIPVCESGSKSRVTWDLFESNCQQVEEFTSVMAAIWEDADGERFLLAYNYSDSEADATVDGRSITVAAKSFFKQTF